MALRECRFCRGPLRRVKSDGSAVYMNGDRTTTPVEGHSRCGCGFKHYWNGREHDNMPERSDLHVTIATIFGPVLRAGIDPRFCNEGGTSTLGLQNQWRMPSKN